MLEKKNKELVEKWFALFCAGEFDKAFDLFAEDAIWFVPPSLARADHYTPEQVKAVGQKVAEAAVDGKFRIVPLSLTAEGDRVAVQAESNVPLKNGKCYNQHYHFLFVIRNNQFSEAYEYLDTLHIRETLEGVLF